MSDGVIMFANIPFNIGTTRTFDFTDAAQAIIAGDEFLSVVGMESSTFWSIADNTIMTVAPYNAAPYYPTAGLLLEVLNSFDTTPYKLLWTEANMEYLDEGIVGLGGGYGTSSESTLTISIYFNSNDELVLKVNSTPVIFTLGHIGGSDITITRSNYKQIVEFWSPTKFKLISPSESDSITRGTDIVFEGRLSDSAGNSITSTNIVLRAITLDKQYYTYSNNTLRLAPVIPVNSFSCVVASEDYPNLTETFTAYLSGSISGGGGSGDGGGVSSDTLYLSGGVQSTGQTGGGGLYGRSETSDSVSIDTPTGSVYGHVDEGCTFTRYLCNAATLQTFGTWLWTDSLGLQIAKGTISLLYGNPSQALISLMNFPFSITSLSGVTTTTGNIHWGGFDSRISSIVITSPAGYIDWGSISIQEYWGNFLDYAPHTQIDLYLPWGTGFVSLDPTQVMGKSISVCTNVDLLKGSCVHIISNSDGSVIGSYAGQCAQQVPLLSNDYASKAVGLVTAAANGMVALGAVGAAGGMALNETTEFMKRSVKYGQSSPLSPKTYFGQSLGENLEAASPTIRTAGRLATTSLAINRHPPTITRNSGFTDGSGGLGIQYPYIILSRPSQSMPHQYGSHYGYPANFYTQLGLLGGYTEVGDIHLEGINAYSEEIDELDKILKAGVIF